jgi:hypothetical protein
MWICHFIVLDEKRLVQVRWYQRVSEVVIHKTKDKSLWRHRYLGSYVHDVTHRQDMNHNTISASTNLAQNRSGKVYLGPSLHLSLH